MFTTEVYKPNLAAWEKIQDRIIALEQEAFGEKAFSVQELAKDFLNEKNTIILLKDSDLVIGFTYARSLDEADEPGREDEIGETAYMWDTVIQKEYRGRHLVGVLMNALEEELRRKKYRYVERVAAVANNYANNIAKHYKDRIVRSEPRETKYGSQVFFRIKL